MGNNNMNNTKNGGQAKKDFCFKVKTGRQIQDSETVEKECLVDGIITPGLNLLSAPRKRSKSWLALDMALCVAGNRDFLGLKTGHGKVLYFALEDTEDRIKTRMGYILDDADAPDNLMISFSTGRAGSDFAKDLDAFLDAEEGVKLVIIDVLQKIRMDRKSNQTEYSHDYKECGRLKEIADKHGISMLVVHHNRKTKDKSDPMNNIAGGVGVPGASDTILMLSGGALGKQNTLTVSSRDLPEKKVAVAFDMQAYQWKYLGTEEELDIKKDEEEYAASPVIQIIKALLEKNASWTGTISDFIEQSKGITDALAGLSASAVARKINKFDDLLQKDGIAHIKPNPNGGLAGRKHIFVKMEGMSEVTKISHMDISPSIDMAEEMEDLKNMMALSVEDEETPA